MVFAWICFISISIPAARYLKGFYKSKKPFGTPVWFQVSEIFFVLILNALNIS